MLFFNDLDLFACTAIRTQNRMGTLTAMVTGTATVTVIQMRVAQLAMTIAMRMAVAMRMGIQLRTRKWMIVN